MASPRVITGLPTGLVVTNTAAPPYNMFLQDLDAGTLRKDLSVDQDGVRRNVTIIGVRIGNTLNPSQKVWLKFWDAEDPSPGSDPPSMVLRCRAGKVTEYIVPWQFSYLSYQVVTSPGTPGTSGPSNAVTVDLAFSIA